VRIAIICDNFSPHLTTARDGRVGAWAAGNNVEIAYTPTDSSWLNRIEAQLRAMTSALGHGSAVNGALGQPHSTGTAGSFPHSAHEPS
jgi:hypothetical protein